MAGNTQNLRQQSAGTTGSMANAAAVADGDSQQRKRFWTTTEVASLRELCARRCSWEEVEKALPGRTQVAIYQKAGELGLPTTWVREKRAANDDLDAALRERLGSGSASPGDVAEIARRFQMPAWYVSRRARKLGLSASSARLKEPEWTSAELEILEAYGEAGTAVTHRQLRLAGSQRTIGSVCAALRRRGIERLAQPSMSARAAAELMGVEGKTIVRWIEHGGLKARRVEGTWSIDRRELRRWLFNNPDSFDLRKVRQVWFMELMKGD